jgi:transposase-like protein
MILHVLHCPHCQGTDMVRHGQPRQGKQRYRCRAPRCAGRTLLLDSRSPGQSPAVKQQIVERAMHASGRRDTARVLPLSTPTVMTACKNRPLTSRKSTPR